MTAVGDLLSCPFCGRVEGFQVKTVWKTYKLVACRCKAAGPVARTEDEAVSAWNERPPRECTFTLEYDRDEVERRRKAHDNEPFGLFPQDMPGVAWTCSVCGQQYRCHYEWNEGEGYHLKPIPGWMRCCPNCGSRIANSGGGID